MCEADNEKIEARLWEMVNTMRKENQEAWLCRESAIRWNDLYDGETYDASYEPEEWQNARAFLWPKDILIPQEGEEIREKERIAVQEVLHTPAGETVLDFGQEVTGYVEFTVDACKGDRIRILHGEVLA